LAVGRKIEDERDALQCLRKVGHAGLTVGEWARAHGIDGRSLHAWRIAIARRGVPARRRKASAKSKRAELALVELVPAAPVLECDGARRYVLVVGAARVEFGDDVSVATLRCVFEALRSC
jgi:transposase-like protein